MKKICKTFFNIFTGKLTKHDHVPPIPSIPPEQQDIELLNTDLHSDLVSIDDIMDYQEDQAPDFYLIQPEVNPNYMIRYAPISGMSINMTEFLNNNYPVHINDNTHLKLKQMNFKFGK